MIDVARAFFRLNVPRLPEAELTQFAQRVFSDFELAADKLLPLDDFGVYVAVEEGSIKGGGKILVTAAALYVGIGQFGSFVQGVKEIERLGRSVAARFIDAAASQPQAEGRADWKRSDAGAVTQLERLFERVQQRELAPSEATAMALALFEPGGELPTGAPTEIAHAFEQVKLHPEQFDFDFADEEQLPEPEPPERRAPRPRVPFVPARLLIEIERDSRGTEPSIRRRYRKK